MKISKQPRSSSGTNRTKNINIIISIIISLIQIIISISLLSSGGANLFSPCSAVRLARQSQLFFPSSNEQHHLEARQSNSNSNNPVPYKTFYVSRACEWKSNLFVPKTNDILFAQSSHSNSQQTNSNQQHANHLQESSVSYFDTQASATATGIDTAHSQQRPPTGYNNNYFNSRQSASTSAPAPAPPPPDPNGFDGGGGVGSSRTVLLSTDSKALVLALPTQTSQTFTGYEPACSIRLIVPRNMRILAKLSSRRLTFSQEQQFDAGLDQFMPPPPTTTLLAFDEIQAQQQQPQPQVQPQLWLNVSQNQFIETEQRIIETNGNVLALRFLLDRFASRQQPDLRFQLVLTAFQTLGENSGDLSAANGGPNSQQIICDQQRLIAANLACDGFRNCQDGHDEEASTCALLNPPRTTWQQQQQANSLDTITRNQLGTSQLANETTQKQQQQTEWILTRVWNSATRTESSIAGFLFGFLLVLLILCCCTCCAYLCVFVVWRRYCLGRRAENEQQQSAPKAIGRRQRNIQIALAAAAADDDDLDDSQAEAESLAQAQNFENSARQQQKQMPPRLHSILKRPAAQRPMEAPPAAPSNKLATNRGALSSHLLSTSSSSRDFKPTPAKRLTRPTRPVPVPISISVPQEAPQRIHQNADPETATPTTATTSANQGGPTTTTGTTTTTSSSYSYSSVGTIRYSEQTSYYDGRGQLVTGPVAPPSAADPNYSRHRRDESASVSPRASLI